MTHEFEVLLFSKPDEICTALNRPETRGQLEQVRASFSTPEEINEGPGSAPSRRIITISPGYQKAVHGPVVANRIGLQLIREQCTHFNQWIAWLEGL